VLHFYENNEQTFLSHYPFSWNILLLHNKLVQQPPGTKRTFLGYAEPTVNKTMQKLQFIWRHIIQTSAIIIVEYHCYKHHTTILSNILFLLLLSRLSPYIDEIIGLRCNRSTTDQIFIIRQILEKKWEYNETVHQLFIDLKKAYDSVRREVLYNILIEFGVLMKLVRLITMCLNETYSKVRMGKHLPERFRTRNGLQQGDALSALLFNFALEYAIKKVHENQVGLKLKGTHQILAYTADVILLGDNIDTIKKNTETLTDASKGVGLEINAQKTKYMLPSHHHSVGQNQDIKIANKSYENVSQFRYLGMTVTNQNLIREESKRRLNSGNACHHSVQNLLSSHLLVKNVKIRIYKNIILPVVLYACDIWSLTLRRNTD
jgi:hypothetical protein